MITKNELNRVLGIVNKEISNAGHNYHARISQRGTHLAIELAYNDAEETTPRTLKTGLTIVQTYAYIEAMLGARTIAVNVKSDHAHLTATYSRRGRPRS